MPGQVFERLLNNGRYSLPRPMASASIKAMIPMTMIGKNFKGSRDKICAATASASEPEELGREGGSRGAPTLSDIELRASHVSSVPSVQSTYQPIDSSSLDEWPCCLGQSHPPSYGLALHPSLEDIAVG